jgi:hypothetical protein
MDGDKSLKLPEEYWRRVERDPVGRALIAGERWAGAFRRDVEEIVKIVNASGGSRQLVWRGQADADHGLSSSLFRKALATTSLTDISEKLLTALEAEIISYARKSGLGHNMTSLELLVTAQHYGIPTRLIDVSSDPFSAIWFATNMLQRKDARLFMFAVPSDVLAAETPGLSGLPWQTIPLKDWTNRVAYLSPVIANPRVKAQNGGFLVGGLAKNYAGSQKILRDKSGRQRAVPKEQIHEISQLYVHFPIRLTEAMVRKWKPNETYGVTWRIPSGVKSELLRAVGTLNIDARTIYPDYESAAQGLGEHLKLT